MPEIIEKGQRHCTGHTIGNIVRWAEQEGIPLDSIAIEPYNIVGGIWGVVAVWYGRE